MFANAVTAASRTARSGSRAEALRLLEQACGLNGLHYACTLYKARWLADQGSVADAVATFEAAAERLKLWHNAGRGPLPAVAYTALLEMYGPGCAKRSTAI